jgi:drug/metabolite transporter (DMT)-like permease
VSALAAEKARPTFGPYAPLALAVLCISAGSVFVRLAQAPAAAVAFQRVFLACLVLVPFALPELLRAWPRLGTRERLTMLGAGVALGLHFVTWIASLSYTTVAASVVLVNTTPLFSVALSRALLGEPVSPVVPWAALLALLGAGIIAADGWKSGTHSLDGDVLALAGAVTLSIYHVAGRGLRNALPLEAYVLGVWSAAAATVAVVAVSGGIPLFDHPPRAYLMFALLALLPTLAGHGLVNRALRELKAPTVGLFLLGEPIGAAALAWLVLGEVPGTWTTIGALVVLLSLALVIRGAEA